MVPYLSWLERAAHDRFVAGSSPAGTTKGEAVTDRSPFSFSFLLYMITEPGKGHTW